jgi:hypothetical protein
LIELRWVEDRSWELGGGRYLLAWHVVVARVVQVLEETTRHVWTFAWNQSFLAIFLPEGYFTIGRKAVGMAGRSTGSY